MFEAVLLVVAAAHGIYLPRASPPHVALICPPLSSALSPSYQQNTNAFTGLRGISWVLPWCASCAGESAPPAADLVTSIPGFPAFYFKAYSGYLAVTVRDL